MYTKTHEFDQNLIKTKGGRLLVCLIYFYSLFSFSRYTAFLQAMIVIRCDDYSPDCSSLFCWSQSGMYNGSFFAVPAGMYACSGSFLAVSTGR